PPYDAGIYLYLREAPQAAPQVTITDKDGKKVADFQAEKTPGLQRMAWRLGAGGEPKGGELKGGKGGPKGGGKGAGPKGGAAFFRPVAAGTYTVSVQVGDLVLRRPVQVETEE